MRSSNPFYIHDMDAVAARDRADAAIVANNKLWTALQEIQNVAVERWAGIRAEVKCKVGRLVFTRDQASLQWFIFYVDDSEMDKQHGWRPLCFESTAVQIMAMDALPELIAALQRAASNTPEAVADATSKAEAILNDLRGRR